MEERFLHLLLAGVDWVGVKRLKSTRAESMFISDWPRKSQNF